MTAMTETHERHLTVIDPRRERVRLRRERLAMDKIELAEAAGINRDTVAAVEAGGGRKGSLIKLEQALDALEAEAGLPAWSDETAEIVDLPTQPQGEDMVEFTIEGNFGVRAVVKGPVRDIEALQAAVAKLVAGMQDPTGPEIP